MKKKKFTSLLLIFIFAISLCLVSNINTAEAKKKKTLDISDSWTQAFGSYTSTYHHSINAGEMEVYNTIIMTYGDYLEFEDPPIIVEAPDFDATTGVLRANKLGTFKIKVTTWELKTYTFSVKVIDNLSKYIDYSTVEKVELRDGNYHITLKNGEWKVYFTKEIISNDLYRYSETNLIEKTYYKIDFSLYNSSSHIYLY